MMSLDPSSLAGTTCDLNPAFVRIDCAGATEAPKTATAKMLANN
jgi:hypothetical protein